MRSIEKGRMKAAFLYGPKDIRIEEMEIPKPDKGEVLVRVKAIGICPSDVRIYEGVYRKKLTPYGKESYGLSGHEWSGEIVEVGGGVKDFSVHDRVVPEIIVPCGRCKFCMKGMTNLCINKSNVVRGYAEYAKAPAKQMFKIPGNISFEETCFTEPLAVCIHTNEIISPKLGGNVVIIGGGPMGLLHLQLTQLSGAKVILSELIERRLELSKKMGADIVINPNKQDLGSKVKTLTNGYGADAVIVATGGKAAIEDAFKTVSSAGTIVIFGGTYPPTKIEVDPNIIHYGEIKVTGSYDHMPIHVEKALKILSSKMVNVKQLISHSIPLNKLKEGFEIVKNAKGLKVIVKP